MDGMDGVVGNAVGFHSMPSAAEREEAFAAFYSLPLLDQDANGPMLVVNGPEDVHVPMDDTLEFEGRLENQARQDCLLARVGPGATEVWVPPRIQRMPGDGGGTAGNAPDPTPSRRSDPGRPRHQLSGQRT
ncbi:hypothetical protein [Streptomyces sp. NPDC056921]|uniref:hypothetical protein n=1 Tax=Streptomyces sp. NPDC056921 TaxID=3345966 RepID=UPI003637244B